MKKKTTIILMILLLVSSFVMAGCGNDNDAKGAGDNVPGVNNGANDNGVNDNTRNNDNNLGDDIDRAGDDIRDDVDNMLGGNDNEGRTDDDKDLNDTGINNRDNNKVNGAA